MAKQMKNLPAVQQTPVHFLGWEYPLEKWQLTPLSGKSHGQWSLAGYSPWGTKSQTRPSGSSSDINVNQGTFLNRKH